MQNKSDIFIENNYRGGGGGGALLNYVYMYNVSFWIVGHLDQWSYMIISVKQRMNKILCSKNPT